MKIQASLIAISLMVIPSVPAMAGDFKTIPPQIVKVLKKGSRLSLVWKAPGFDGSKGCTIGHIDNQSVNDADGALERFPFELKSLVQADSPYVLSITVVQDRMTTSPGGDSSARVEVEGRVVDSSGAIVAAFDTLANPSIGGNKRDNEWLAVRQIAGDIKSELFGMGGVTKLSSIIVATPKSKSTAVIAGKPSKENPSKVIVEAPSSQKTVVSSQQSTESAPKLNEPEPPAPTVLTEPLQAAIAGGMKRGHALEKVWFNPAYNKRSGFTIGEVRYLVDERNAGISDYLPEALAGIAKQDSEYTLYMGIVQLIIKSRLGGSSSDVRLVVDGRVVDKEGNMMAAFRTSEHINGIGIVEDDCHTAARKVIEEISKEFR
jgi:hypothetical protein